MLTYGGRRILLVLSWMESTGTEEPAPGSGRKPGMTGGLISHAVLPLLR